MDLKYENLKLQQGFSYIVGCDEVGRGCLAGPVVAAAVILNLQSDSSRVKPYGFNRQDLKLVNDSKLLSPEKREKIEPIIKQNALAWGIGVVERSIIDEINIHNASLLAMKMAVADLCHCQRVQPSAAINHLNKDCFIGQLPKAGWPSGNGDTIILIDGKFPIPNFDLPQEAIIDGDAKVLSIAAASIVAKVYRDNLMKQLDKQFPQYSFAQHKGYATAQHRTAIKKFGLTPIHRLTFCGQYL